MSERLRQGESLVTSVAKLSVDPDSIMTVLAKGLPFDRDVPLSILLVTQIEHLKTFGRGWVDRRHFGLSLMEQKRTGAEYMFPLRPESVARLIDGTADLSSPFTTLHVIADYNFALYPIPLFDITQQLIDWAMRRHGKPSASS